MAWYPWQAIWAHPSTYTRGRGGKKPEYIVVHYTASQASARNNCKYFSGGNRNSSAHFFADGSGTIYQSVAEGDTAWAVGNFDMNQRSISIEVVSDGRDFSSAEIAELTYLVQHLMQKYGIPASHVIRHYDVVDHVRQGRTLAPHKHCPAPYVNNAKWNRLHGIITAGGGWKRGQGTMSHCWWYQHADGSYTSNGWELIDDKWYYFDANGWMATGWQKHKGYWYYLSDSGSMVVGWQFIDDRWYYFRANGSMATGWLQDGEHWYWLHDTHEAGLYGSMDTGWIEVNGKKYYANPSSGGPRGALVCGKQTIDGKEYEFDSNCTLIEDKPNG